MSASFQPFLMSALYVQATNKDLESQLQGAKTAQEASQKLEGSLKEVQAQLAEAKKSSEAQERRQRHSEVAAQVVTSFFVLAGSGVTITITEFPSPSIGSMGTDVVCGQLPPNIIVQW